MNAKMNATHWTMSSICDHFHILNVYFIYFENREYREIAVWHRFGWTRAKRRDHKPSPFVLFSGKYLLSWEYWKSVLRRWMAPHRNVAFYSWWDIILFEKKSIDSKVIHRVASAYINPLHSQVTTIIYSYEPNCLVTGVSKWSAVHWKKNQKRREKSVSFSTVTDSKRTWQSVSRCFELEKCIFAYSMLECLASVDIQDIVSEKQIHPKNARQNSLFRQ